MSTWLVRESEVPARTADVHSTVFCVGNGRSCTRGTHSEERHDAYRGVYMAGTYTRAGWGLIYMLGGPDWLRAFVRAGGAVVRDVGSSERVLDMRSGTLSRTAVLRGPGGLRVKIEEERFASMAHKNIVAQRYAVTVLDAGTGTAPVEICVGIDGDTRNHRAKYYTPGQFPNSDETGLRLTAIEAISAEGPAVRVVVKARSTGNRIACAARVVQAGGPELAVRSVAEGGEALRVFTVPAGASVGKTVVIEKVAALAGDLPGFEDAVANTEKVCQALPAYAAAREAHVAAMSKFWDVADVVIDGHEQEQRGVRYAIWSTRIAAPDDGGRSSLGAKNLSGDWYRGAVFWDMEMFQLPMLAAVSPELARNHVMYRANRIGAARTLAAQDGYDGARYPWQSYFLGDEQPPVMGGFLYQQQHVNLAVAWGMLHYVEMTGDEDFLVSHGGLETLVELSRFWCSRVTPRQADGKYHILTICGPDENHAPVDDNAYTSRLVVWQLERMAELVARLSADPRAAAVLEKLGVDGKTLARWADVRASLFIPADETGGVMLPFTGYEKLPEPDDAIKDKSLSGDNRFKQADTLMTFQALPGEFSDAEVERHWLAYAPLCDQTSSLSLSTHALLAIRLRLLRDAKRLFRMTTGADLRDVMGNTCDGIHAAAQGGIWMSTVQGFGGLTIAREKVSVNPSLPPWYERLAYQFIYRGQRVAVAVTRGHVEVANRSERALTLEVAGKAHTVAGGKSVTVPHAPAWRDLGLQGVIFDLDGVLVTTDQFHFQAWKELADELGLTFDERINHQLRGVSREDSLRAIYRNNPGVAVPDEKAFAAYCTRKNERYKELVSRMTPADVLPGALELLKALRAAGIKVGIASASRNAQAVLERTGLTSFVDAVSDGNNITAGKPDAQVFYVAAQRLRLLPWDCVGVEDAATGIESIRRAGMAAVGIGDAAVGADATVGHVRELSVDLLRKVFAEHESPLDPYLERSLAHIRKFDKPGGYSATTSHGAKK